MSKISLFVCMGSACHQKGVYQVLKMLEKMLVERGLDSQIELKGGFCLGPCMSAIVLKVHDQLIVNVTADNLEEKFANEILPLLVGVDG